MYVVCVQCQEYYDCAMILPVLHCPYDISDKDKCSVLTENIRIKEEVSMFSLKEKK